MQKFHESRENMSNDAVMNMIAATRSLKTVMVNQHSASTPNKNHSTYKPTISVSEVPAPSKEHVKLRKELLTKTKKKSVPKQPKRKPLLTVTKQPTTSAPATGIQSIDIKTFKLGLA